MGLVELMIWAALALLITTVIGTVYVNSKQITRVNDSTSRLQENGRFAVYLLDRDFRMAGFRGCNTLGAVVPVGAVNVLNSTAYPYQFAVSVVGYFGSGGTWSPGLDASISGLSPSPLANSDVITIRTIDGGGAALTATMANSSADITVTPGSNFAAGDVLMVANCSNYAIFNATGYSAGTGAISHEVGIGVPGNSTKDLGQAFSIDSAAAVYRLVTRTYYVAPSVRRPGTNSLWINSVPAYDGQVQPEEMVEGVDKLALLFGEDLDGDGAANRYVAANAVGTWSNVVSVKPQLLLATVRDNIATKPQPYTFNGTSTTPTDKRVRTALSSVITVRNRVP
jgi:type IV pilus assembly protein PilW